MVLKSNLKKKKNIKFCWKNISPLCSSKYVPIIKSTIFLMIIAISYPSFCLLEDDEEWSLNSGLSSQKLLNMPLEL